MLISKVGGLLLFLFRLSCSAPSHDLHTVALARRSVDANGNGVTFPTTAIPLTMGKSYVCTFVTGSQISWDTISVDLYNVAGQSYFIANLVKIDPSEAINPINPLSGSIPFTVPTNVGTGPLYVIIISGIDANTGNLYTLPPSSTFQIINPYAGDIIHPTHQDVWYTGRNVEIDFTLGSAFQNSGTTSFRVEMASSAIPQVYTVVQSAPATSAMLSGKASAIMFDIPTSFTIGQAYFVRLVPNDGIYGSLASNKNGVVTSTLSLPSASFTLFASSVIINPYLAVNITTSEATAPLPVSQPVTTYAGSQLTFSWKWSSKPPISSWQIDLFSIGQASSLYTGKTIASRIQGNTYAWSIDQDLPAGAYYARVWEGASAEEGTDPVSAVSAVFTLYNTETQPPLKFHVFAATPWSAGCRANITWTVTQQASSFELMGWTIDLYKNSLPYKLLQTLTPTPLSPDTTWTLVNIPASLVLSNDYSVRLRAVLDPNAYPNQDVGSVTPFFKVLASPADQKTWNTTCIALFPGNAKPTVKSAGVATNAVTRGNQTRGAGAQPGNPNPFGNPNGAVLRPSAISSLILMAMFGVLA